MTNGTTLADTPGAETGIGYGWVGSKQRATQPHGLILMGARPYNPTTGQFTSMDPVYGGNATTYTYPQDPVNGYDLDGRVGVTYTRRTGSKVYVNTAKHKKIAEKHNIHSKLLISGAIYHMKFSHYTLSNDLHDGRYLTYSNYKATIWE